MEDCAMQSVDSGLGVPVPLKHGGDWKVTRGSLRLT